MKTCIESITPNKAKEYLEHNNVNRKVSMPLVETYARDMLGGVWQLNGDSIKFYTDGSLFDGQHRLLAIIKSGKAISTVVMREIPKTITITDFGRKRSDVDSFLLEGADSRIANNANVALVKLHYKIQTGRGTVSHAELENFFIKHQEVLYEIHNLVSKHNKKDCVNIRSAFIMTAMYYAIESGVSEQVLDRFLETLRSGRYGSQEEEAALVLRNDIIGKRIDYRGGANRKNAVFSVEKAICDYEHRLTRKNTYSTYCRPTYSCNPKFKEECL